MRAVPRGLREAAYALGATRMQTAVQVVVPAAFSGITAAFILAASRAIGETMIVAIAAGQQPRLTANPFVPIETMTAYIVQVSLGDTPQGTLEYRTIFAVGMLLFLMTFVLNLVSGWLRARFREEYASGDRPGPIAVEHRPPPGRRGVPGRGAGGAGRGAGRAGGAGRHDLVRRRRAAQLDVPDQLSVAAGRERRHLSRHRRQPLRHRADRGAGPAGRRRRRHLPRGVRRPEPRGALHRAQHRQPRRGAVDHLRPARAGPVRAGDGHGPQRAGRRLHARPAGAAGGDPLDARSAAHGAEHDSRRLLRARRHQVADDLAPGAADGAARAC